MGSATRCRDGSSQVRCRRRLRCGSEVGGSPLAMERSGLKSGRRCSKHHPWPQPSKLRDAAAPAVTASNSMWPGVVGTTSDRVLRRRRSRRQAQLESRNPSPRCTTRRSSRQSSVVFIAAFVGHPRVPRHRRFRSIEEAAFKDAACASSVSAADAQRVTFILRRFACQFVALNKADSAFAAAPVPIR